VADGALIEAGYLRRIRDLDLAGCKFDDTLSSFETICKRLNSWMENLLSNGLDEFNAVITTIQNYKDGILNYFRYGMTNAIAEGFNTKINVIKRRAFGYRDIEYFILKIYPSSLRRHICGLLGKDTGNTLINTE